MTEITEKTHVDSYIWDTLTDGDVNEDYAKWMLMHFRLPALQKSMFKKFLKDQKLFCDYEGKTYAVIGASRLGDIWLTSNLEGEFPYELRVCVFDCKNFRPEV